MTHPSGHPVVRNPRGLAGVAITTQFYVGLQPKPRNSEVTYPTELPCAYPKTSYHARRTTYTSERRPELTFDGFGCRKIRGDIVSVIYFRAGCSFCTHHIRTDKIMSFYEQTRRYTLMSCCVLITVCESSHALPFSRVYNQIHYGF